MKINCIIIEDEPLALERVRQFAGRLHDLEISMTYNNGASAVAGLEKTKPDLIFLDMHLGDISGIQLLESANIQCPVIITTAYDQYALQGYDLNVTDYLLKPFTFERFHQAVDKARVAIEHAAAGKITDFLFVRTEYRLEKILFSEVLFIEGMRDYRRIHTTSKNIMTLQTFREFEQLIPEHIICRVHKSFMVATGKIESIERDRIKIGNTIIPVSESYRKKFYALIRGQEK